MYIHKLQIEISLQAQGSTIALTEVEIWVRENPSETEQTPYVNSVGAVYLLPQYDNTRVYTFDKVWLFFPNNID